MFCPEEAMLPGGGEALEFNVCTSNSVGQKHTNPNDERLCSKSSCKSGRRKQTKPVKMLRSDDNETEGGLIDFSLLLETDGEEHNEMNECFSLKETIESSKHQFCFAKEIGVRTHDTKDIELVQHFHEDSRVTCPKGLDSNLSDECLESCMSEKSMEADAGPGRSEARIRDPIGSTDLKRWNGERRDSVSARTFWSRESENTTDRGNAFLEMKCVIGDSCMLPNLSEEDINVLKTSLAVKSEITEKRIAEVAKSNETMDNKVNENKVNGNKANENKATENNNVETAKTPYSESSETAHRGTITATMVTKTIKNSLASNRESSNIVKEHHSNSPRIPISKTMERASGDASETAPMLNIDRSKTEEKFDKDLTRKEKNELSSSCFQTDTATNLASHDEMHSNATGDGCVVVGTDFLVDSQHCLGQTRLGKLHRSLHVPASVNTEPRRTEEGCKTSVQQLSFALEDYCDICHKRFCNKYYLKKHRHDVHSLVGSASEAVWDVLGLAKVGTDDDRVQAHLFDTDSPPGCSRSVRSPGAFSLERTPDCDARASSSSSTSTLLLKYLLFGNAGETSQRALPDAMYRTEGEFSTLCRSSEASQSDASKSYLTNTLSLITENFHSPGSGFVDAYLKLCHDMRGNVDGKSEWERANYKRHEIYNTLLCRSLAEFQTDAFARFRNDCLMFANCGKDTAQGVAMDNSGGSSYGGIFPLEGKRPFDLFSSHVTRKNGCASGVMSHFLEAGHLLNSGAEPTKTVSGFTTGRGSDRVVCDLCGKEVCNKYFLKTHKTRLHGWKEDVYSNPPGFRPFSSTLSYLVDGVVSSRHAAEDKFYGRKAAEETTLSTDLSSKDRLTKDLTKKSCVGESTRKITTATDTVNCQSTSKECHDFPFWLKAPPSAKLTLNEGDTSEALFDQGSWKEAGASSPISCPLCNKVVGNAYFLRTHMKRRHEIGGRKDGVKRSDFGRTFQSFTRTVNDVSRLGPQPVTKVPKASKNFLMSANRTMTDNTEILLDYDAIGSGIFPPRCTEQNPEENGVRGTCVRDEGLEKSSSERNFLQRDQVRRKRKRCEPSTQPQLSLEAAATHSDTHELYPKPSLCYIGSKEGGQHPRGRIRCSNCRKRFRSSVQLNAHVCKVPHNPQDNTGTTSTGKSSIDAGLYETKTKGKQRMLYGLSLKGRRQTNFKSSAPRVESLAAGSSQRETSGTTMQQFLLREVTGLDLFCPAVVYLPSLRTITNPTSVTFTLTPMLQEELGQFA